MKTPKRKMIVNKEHISELILSNLADLKDDYVRDFGPTNKWDRCKKNIFLLNADLMIENVMELFNENIHDESRSVGLSFGVFKLQVFLTRKYTEALEVKDIFQLDYSNRLAFNKELNLAIYYFLTEGINTN